LLLIRVLLVHVRIVLGSLLNNFNLKLFDANGNELAKSINKKTEDDTIVFNGLSPSTYYVKVFGRNGAFNSLDCYSLMVETSTTPFRESLSQSLPGNVNEVSLFPNPMHSETTILFSLTESSLAEISLLDLQGRKIKKLAQGNISAGDHQLLLQRENLIAGIYFLQLKTENGTVTQKIVVQ